MPATAAIEENCEDRPAISFWASSDVIRIALDVNWFVRLNAKSTENIPKQIVEINSTFIVDDDDDDDDNDDDDDEIMSIKQLK